MTARILTNRGRLRTFGLVLAALSSTIAICVFTAAAQNGSAYFYPGNLVLSRSVYDNNPNNIQVGATLPPDCASGCSTAMGLEQRHDRCQLRHHLEDLPRPDHSVGRAD